MKTYAGVVCALWMGIGFGAAAQSVNAQEDGKKETTQQGPAKQEMAKPDAVKQGGIIDESCDKASHGPLRLIQSIPLPNVEGYFDHMAADVKGQRLFVPGELQRSIEVIDLKTGNVLHSIVGFGGDPRKILYFPETNEIWVDDGDATVKSFDATSYELKKNIPLATHELADDSRRIPDNGAYDPATHLFYLGSRSDSKPNAGPHGSIEIVDLKAGTYVGTIELPAKNPAGLALDAKTNRLYVVMGDSSQTVVVDLQKRAVINTWPITGGPEPHAVAVDSAHRRLLIGSRVKRSHTYRPGKLVIMDADSGNVLNTIDTEAGVDELFYDIPTKRVYYNGSGGYVEVFKQIDADHYQSLGRAATGAIAKTALLVPELHRFYAAVPKHLIITPPVPQAKEVSIEDAKIMVFEVMK